MSQPTRRQFISGAAALGVASQLPSFAVPAMQASVDENLRSLVVIYLRGGADFLNMVIPYTDDDYYASRPTIGMSEEQGIVPLDKTWALHPALKALEPFYREKKLATVLNVGSPHETRSHFDAQDFMEFAAPGDRTVRTGWVNRYLAATAGENDGHFRGLALQSLLPRSFRGDYPVLAAPAGFSTKDDSRVLTDFEKLYGADKDSSKDEMGEREEDRDQVVQSGKVTIEALGRLIEILSEEERDTFGYPRSKFGKGLRSIGRVFAAGEKLEVAGLDYNGWDHHTGQGGVQGRHAPMMLDLAESLAAFCRHLGPRLDKTLIVCMTEFGRTVRENGNAATDHGHGGGMFLLGGGIKGGKIRGDWKGLSSSSLYEGRDLPVTTDFRDVLAEVLREHMDFKAPKGFFPDYRPGRVKLF